MNRVAVPETLDPIALRPPPGPVVSLSGPTMGVRWTLKAVPPPEVPHAAMAAAAQAAVDAVVAAMSTWEPDSEISRFNRAPAGQAVVLGEDFTRVIDHALAIADITGGAFDPTLGRLTDLWGFGPAGERLHAPDQDATRDATASAGWRRLDWNVGRRTLVQPGGLALDLSGIAKGYGVDRIGEAMQALGVRHYLAEIGGEFAGAGVKPDRQPWWVSVEPPPGLALPGDPILFGLHGCALATSGDYRRFRLDEGRRRSHSLDPRTGAPVEDAPASVSVMAADCMTADALCTALTVMGADAGLAFAETQGVAALFLLRTAAGLEERLSPALRELIEG